MAQRLDSSSVNTWLGKLTHHLSPNDLELLTRLHEGLDATDRILVADALNRLYPSATANNASSYLRQLRGRLDAAANETGTPLTLTVTPGKRGGAAKRWLWFEGEDPVADLAQRFSDAETAELDHLPAVSRQRGLPLDDKPLVRWFLCWAHENAKLKDSLFEDLDLRLKNSKHYRFQAWHEGLIPLGANWRASIERALSEADFGLLLLSDAFLQSSFIQEVELPALLEKHVVPVCLRKLDFERVDLRGLEEKQVFVDSQGTAYSERRGEKRKAWSDELAAKIEDLLEHRPPGSTTEPGPPSPTETVRGRQPLLSHHELIQCLPALDRTEQYLVRNTRALPTGLDKDRVEDFRSDGDSGVDTLEHLMGWVAETSAPPLFALLGEYGMGKTITCQRLVRELEARRKESPTLPPPLYLDLRNLTGLDRGVPTLEEIVVECLQRGRSAVSVDAFDFPRFERLAAKGALVIFDGLDEALVHLKESDGQVFTRELLKLLPQEAGAHATKLLISCRTHYFRTLRDQKNHFTGQERGPVSARDYRALLLLPFTEEQVGDYLAKALPGMDVPNLQETIRSVHNLTELTQRPFTLKLVANFIPDIERWRAAGRVVNGVTLYRRLVQSWLERDAGKHQLKADHKMRLMARLAAELWRARRRVFSASDLESWFMQWLDESPELGRRYSGLHPDKLEEDLRTATFLVRQDAENPDEAGFRFAHSSLQEFFLADHLHQALLADRRQDWAMPMPSPETLDFLGQMLAESNAGAGVRTLNSWRTPYLAQASELQLAYALEAHKKGWPAPRLTGMALPGAQLAGWRFEGRKENPLDLTAADFTGANLGEAEFRYVALDQARFIGTRLEATAFLDCTAEGADFSKAKLTAAVFRQTRLGGAVWDGVSPHYRAQLIACTDTPAPAELPDALFTPSGPRPNDAKLEAFAGHSSPVRSCAFSPDGLRLVSAGEDGCLRLWDAGSGECLRTLSGHEGRIMSCAFSPDGLRLVSAGEDGRLRLWDADSGECLRTLSGHEGGTMSCAFSPNGFRLVSAGEDGRLRLWDADSGECLRTLSGHEGRVWSCAFSPNDLRLVSAGEDGRLRLWDAGSGECLRTLSGHEGWVWSCAFSPDGQRLVSAGRDGFLRLWDAGSGECPRVLSGHEGWVMSCAFSPDGQRLVSADGGGSLRLWDADSGECLRTLSGHEGRVWSCGFSSDGLRLVSAGRDGSLRLWDAANGECLRTLSGHERGVMSCAFSADGLRLVSAGEDGRLRLWDAGSGECLRTLSGHEGRVWSCAFSPVGQRLVSAGEDGSLRLWDAGSGECLHTLSGHEGRVMSCSFSPDGLRLVSAGEDGRLRLWDADSGECLRTLSGHEGRVWSCAFSPNGLRLVSAGEDGSLRLWDAGSGECLRTLSGPKGGTMSCAFSPDGQRLVSAGRDGFLRLWDAGSGECPRVLSGHEGWVMSCAFSPDGQRLVSAGRDGFLRLWDAGSGECLRTLSGHRGWVWSLAFSPDGQRLVSACIHGSLRLWDAASGECLRIHAVFGRGHAVWSPGSSEVIEATGDAWRWLGWRVPDGRGGYTRLPAESFGPLPPPRRLESEVPRASARA